MNLLLVKTFYILYKIYIFKIYPFSKARLKKAG